jgi:hypothetical protein
LARQPDLLEVVLRSYADFEPVHRNKHHALLALASRNCGP